QWNKQTSAKARGLVDLFVNAGKLPHRPPSTVIDTTKERLQVVRMGGISMENIDTESITKNEDETRELGVRMIEKYRENLENKTLVFALSGDLGAGKTRFAQG